MEYSLKYNVINFSFIWIIVKAFVLINDSSDL